ncbi:MAG: hypothetical protein PHZ09_10010 [Eubacteriales bacterium]|jgi:hypothetical protein|nr:hypothetical protein [Eubacteriales bacterium]
MTGELITHKVFGRGRVISMEDGYINILFEDEKYGEKVFVYPDCCDRFVKFDDGERQSEAVEKYKVIQTREREEKERDEAENKKYAEMVNEARIEFAKKKTPAKPKATKKTAVRAKIKKTENAAE